MASSWWVVQYTISGDVTSGVSALLGATGTEEPGNLPSSTQVTVIQAASSADAKSQVSGSFDGLNGLTITNVYGPYSTEAAADKVASSKGSSGINIATAESDLSAAAEGAATAGASTANGSLLDISGLGKWLERAGLVLGGVFLIALGLSKLTDAENAITQLASKIPIIPV
jgi:hypothetical protein